MADGPLQRRQQAAEELLQQLNREHLEEIGAVEAMALVLRFCAARDGRGPLPLYGGLALHLLCCACGREPVYKTFDQLDCDALSFQFGADAVEISQELYSAGFPDASATFALSGPETIKVHAASVPLLDLHELPSSVGARTLMYIRRQGTLVDPVRADPSVTGAVMAALPAHKQPPSGAPPLKLLICPTSWLLRNMANELATPLNVPSRKPKILQRLRMLLQLRAEEALGSPPLRPASVSVQWPPADPLASATPTSGGATPPAAAAASDAGEASGKGEGEGEGAFTWEASRQPTTAIWVGTGRWMAWAEQLVASLDTLDGAGNYEATVGGAEGARGSAGSGMADGAGSVRSHMRSQLEASRAARALWSEEERPPACTATVDASGDISSGAPVVPVRWPSQRLRAVIVDPDYTAYLVGKCMGGDRYEVMWPVAGIAPLVVHDSRHDVYIVAAQECFAYARDEEGDGDAAAPACARPPYLRQEASEPGGGGGGGGRAEAGAGSGALEHCGVATLPVALQLFLELHLAAEVAPECAWASAERRAAVAQHAACVEALLCRVLPSLHLEAASPARVGVGASLSGSLGSEGGFGDFAPFGSPDGFGTPAMVPAAPWSPSASSSTSGVGGVGGGGVSPNAASALEEKLWDSVLAAPPCCAPQQLANLKARLYARRQQQRTHWHDVKGSSALDLAQPSLGGAVGGTYRPQATAGPLERPNFYKASGESTPASPASERGCFGAQSTPSSPLRPAYHLPPSSGRSAPGSGGGLTVSTADDMAPTVEEQAFLERQMRLQERAELRKLRDEARAQHAGLERALSAAAPDAEEQAFVDGEIRKQEAKQWHDLEEQLEAVERQATQLEELRYELHWQQWQLVDEEEPSPAVWQRFDRPTPRSSLASPWHDHYVATPGPEGSGASGGASRARWPVSSVNRESSWTGGIPPSRESSDLL